MTKYHMRLHFHDLADVQRRLLDGKLQEARDFAFLLTTRDSDPSMQQWSEYTMAVADAAREVMHAPSTEEALRREVKVGLACARCHLATEREQNLAPPPELTNVAGLEGRMARHKWAADRLWEGVITPSDERWRQGLEVLSAAPLVFSAASGESQLAESLQRRALLELQQRDASSLEHRVTAYGELLVTCAGCHAIDRANAPGASN